MTHSSTKKKVMIKKHEFRYFRRYNKHSELSNQGLEEESVSHCSNRNSPSVVFADYNSFFLRDVTLPNIILNTCTLLSMKTNWKWEQTWPLKK